ncbi:EAL domain-containing protein [Curvibacter sp. CHRR-16]|uniref:EAL domain-containing protein n=1 Tax=Curvibacter sp. CHRR-16 TaxID=2835872 RepID=UPI001BDB0DCB|nr:EAL domain-containing protein [Curvibacter sp. CHRR-16]MBT0569987.1 EAL domain-containing protein [Curvibacter sp. CHRR-16]
MKISARWPTVVQRINQALGHHASVVGLLTGIAAGLVLASALSLVALLSKVKDIDAGHKQILSSLSRRQSDVDALLTELNASKQATCTPENLRLLRALIFPHPYALEVGLLDKTGMLYCSTSAGALRKPSAFSERYIDGKVGRYYLKVPLHRYNPDAPDTIYTTVVERGPFQVIIAGEKDEQVIPQYSDAVWAGGASQRTRIFASPNAHLLDTVANTDTPHVRIVWTGFYFLITNSVPGVSPISVQSLLLPSTLYSSSSLLLWGSIMLCIVLGALTRLVVISHCHTLLSIDKRIAYLCAEHNIVCHYQPILSLTTGKIIGCEVLARLREGDKLVYPDEFIPSLAQRQLTWEFDSAVCRVALRELATLLPVQADPFTVALNLFPRNLSHDLLHACLKQCLKDYGRSDLRINLEVTEYEFSADALPELKRLQADGYAISIDDFGTGYSNLGILKRMAPDCLKIDKSFVFEMEDATLRSSLIPEILAIANAIGCEVVAEGIETAEQSKRLRALGVQYGQGYFFSRPVPLSLLLSLMERGEGTIPLA